MARVHAQTLGLYALPAAGLTAMHFLVLIYLLKFSTDVLGLEAATVGALFALARVWDAVSDPLVGWLSDRTRSRMGRRRPWMFFAAMPLGLAFLALWTAPADVSGAGLALWLGIALLLYYSAGTCVAIPHFSLGAELSTDHHERTRISGARVGAEILGMVAAITGLYLLESSASSRDTALLVAGTVAGLTIATTIFASLRLEEPAGNAARGAENPFRALADVARNPYAVRVTAVLLLCELGLGSLLVAIPYVAEVTGRGGQSAQMMAGFMAPFAVAIPIWVAVAKRIGKPRAWAVASAVCSVAFAAFFVAEALLLPVALLTAVIGFAQAGMRTMAPSVKADVIDVDEARTGERKEGTYFAAWNLVDKLAGALSVLIVGFAIQAPGGGIDPGGVRLVASLLPAGFVAVAGLLLVGMGLDARAHSEVRRAIDARGRRAGRGAERGFEPPGAAPLAAEPLTSG